MLGATEHLTSKDLAEIVMRLLKHDPARVIGGCHYCNADGGGHREDCWWAATAARMANARTCATCFHHGRDLWSGSPMLCLMCSEHCHWEPKDEETKAAEEPAPVEEPEPTPCKGGRNK